MDESLDVRIFVFAGDGGADTCYGGYDGFCVGCERFAGHGLGGGTETLYGCTDRGEECFWSHGCKRRKGTICWSWWYDMLSGGKNVEVGCRTSGICFCMGGGAA